MPFKEELRGLASFFMWIYSRDTEKGKFREVAQWRGGEEIAGKEKTG